MIWRVVVVAAIVIFAVYCGYDKQKRIAKIDSDFKVQRINEAKYNIASLKKSQAFFRKGYFTQRAKRDSLRAELSAANAGRAATKNKAELDKKISKDQALLKAT